jgi:glycosyltransferase involved in cell wall biosynthesis
MRICMTPKTASRGPGSFQIRLEAELRRLGVETTFDPFVRPLDAVLVFSGTKNLAALFRCRRDGIRIIQRLDGINWLHKVRPYRVMNAIRAETRNLLLRWIRARIAQQIVYQSRFAREWWERWAGKASAPAQIVYNGVPLEEFPPRKKNHDGTLLVAMGHLHYDNPSRQILTAAHTSLVREGPFQRMAILGCADGAWKREWGKLNPHPEVAGLQTRAEVKARQYQASVLLSMDLNPACPNAVIESLAAGLPVIGFDTGSLREVVGSGGEVPTYDGNPWRLEAPRNLDAIREAGRRVMDHWEEYSRRARDEAENKFDIRKVAQQYLDIFTC